VIRQLARKAQDFTNRRYRHAASWMRVERTKNRTKSKVRARVEHSIGIIKRVFGLCQGALPRAEEKRPPPARDLRISQPVRGAPASAALRQGVDYPQCVSTHINNRTLPRQRAVTHPIARRRISMSILLAPTLVQTFPKRPCRRASKGSICRGGCGRCVREVYVDDSDLFAGFANKIRNEGTRTVVRETTIDHQSSSSSCRFQEGCSVDQARVPP